MRYLWDLQKEYDLRLRMRIRLFFAGQIDPGLLDVSSPVILLISNGAPTFTFDRAGLLQGFSYGLVLTIQLFFGPCSRHLTSLVEQTIPGSSRWFDLAIWGFSALPYSHPFHGRVFQSLLDGTILSILSFRRSRFYVFD